MQLHTTQHTLKRFGPNTLSERAGDGWASTPGFVLNTVSVTTIERSPAASMSLTSSLDIPSGVAAEAL